MKMILGLTLTEFLDKFQKTNNHTKIKELLKKYKYFINITEIAENIDKTNISIEKFTKYFRTNYYIWDILAKTKKFKRKHIRKYADQLNVATFYYLAQTKKLTPTQIKQINKILHQRNIIKSQIKTILEKQILYKKTNLHEREKLKLLNIKSKNKPKYYSRKIYINLLAQEMKNK
jgi:hypothetical protein